MPWPIPGFSKKEVNRSGEALVEEQIRQESADDLIELEDLDRWINAYVVLSNWRACHGYPINTFQATLRQRLRKIDKTALVAQRLKRAPSIINKLRRLPGMKLARMQDIGGLRAVVKTMSQLKKLHSTYLDTSLTHELVSEYNYVAKPKASGYRSIHLIYRYKAREASPYDGLLLELQLRTRLQHSWATAVETAGTFLEHSLKSSEGPEEWLRFFALAGNAFSYLEGTANVPMFEDLGKSETYARTISEANRLRIREMLLGYSSAVREIGPGARRAAYYLVELKVGQSENTVSIRSNSTQQLDNTNKEYAESEKKATSTGSQVVLVSAGSIESLKRAYPNYFLDTHEFLANLDRIKS